jgi:hypothetical protein
MQEAHEVSTQQREDICPVEEDAAAAVNRDQAGYLPAQHEGFGAGRREARLRDDRTRGENRVSHT